MRLIVSFDGGGLTINFENISEIYNYSDHIILIGGDHEITVAVNAADVCSAVRVVIQKSWLLTANEVYFDTRIEEAIDG